jgi:hypothetical protein
VTLQKAEMANAAVSRAPFPTDAEQFGDDPRVSLSQVTLKYQLEDERGESWEWNDRISKWVPVV